MLTSFENKINRRKRSFNCLISIHELNLKYIHCYCHILANGINAWATHKYVMHGFLWKLHKDHHQVNKDRILENNDAFFLIFAILAAFMIIGSTLLYVGIGITLYGFAYFIIHEVFIHQRIKLFKRTHTLF